jgi:hypothetical protein
MNKIKFSHNYPKLHDQTSGILIDVTILDTKELSSDLVEYDTRYSTEKSIEMQDREFDDYFPLPKSGELVQLTFIGNKRIPFCTIRSRRGRYGDKFEYYKERIGQEFEIVIQKDVR